MGEHVMTEAPADTTDMDADYRRTLEIAASPDAVFDALTTLSGLSGWWSTVTGSGMAGGELRFVFDDDNQPCIMQVTESERPTTVRWTCLGYEPLADWAGTKLSFNIQPGIDGCCTLRFQHAGLTPRLECYRDCKNGWDHFLPSLATFAQTGVGNPFGSTGDIHRREERQERNANSISA